VKLVEKPAEPALLRSASALLRAAVDFPAGPCFVSNVWTGSDAVEAEGEDGVPSLVVVVITRVTPWGTFIPAFALVDRTCLGVKSAVLGAPRTRSELDEDVAALAAAHGPLTECPLLVAQSVVFSAVDYARTLGFEPHADFPEAFFGPRPESMLDTPFSKPAYPIYIVSPGDPVEQILETLDRSVGSFNYAFMPSEPLSAPGSVLVRPEDEAAAEAELPAAAG
jgi:hypothetical protein